LWNYNNWAAPSQGGPILLAAVLAVAVLALLVVLVRILIRIFVLVVHDEILRLSILAAMPY
jgi:hypothetical protein